MLENKVVIVTGVGGGLGRALAQAFVEQGCYVAGIGHRQDSLSETAAAVPSDKFSVHLADVADFAAVQAVIEQILADHGHIDLVFNNAAIYPKQNFLDEDPAQWARAMAVNVNGIANGCKAVLPGMIARRYGRIYNVGSFADIAPISCSAAYSASKGAVRSLTKAIARDIEHLDADIEIHEWIPGHLRTRMSEFTGIEPRVAAGWAVQLAMQPHARTRNGIYENDREWLPPKGLRQRVKDRLLSFVRPGSDKE